MLPLSCLPSGALLRCIWSRALRSRKRRRNKVECGTPIHLTDNKRILSCRFLEAVNLFKALSMEQQGALGGALSPGERLDAATRRAHKIMRFQLERAVRAELDALKMQVRFLLKCSGQCTWH